MLMHRVKCAQNMHVAKKANMLSSETYCVKAFSLYQIQHMTNGNCQLMAFRWCTDSVPRQGASMVDTGDVHMYEMHCYAIKL